MKIKNNPINIYDMADMQYPKTANGVDDFEAGRVNYRGQGRVSSISSAINRISKVEAKEIVNIIAGDAECKRRIDSGLKIFSSILSSGGLRNIGLLAESIFANDDEEAKIFEKVCTGIADETANVINKAVRAGKVSFVSYAYSKGRIAPVFTFSFGFPGAYGGAVKVDQKFINVWHDATVIKLRNGNDVVFDWHHTLNTQDPLIYNSELDFLNDTEKRSLFSEL